MTGLTRNEEMLLMAVLNLRKDAYLVAIADYLTDILGKNIGITTIHLPLHRLEKRGLIASEMGEATAVRGGRSKRIYSLTRPGFEALERHKRVTDLIWDRFPTKREAEP
jgi:PadR family transcriptional regulator PadR